MLYNAFSIKHNNMPIRHNIKKNVALDLASEDMIYNSKSY